MHSPVPCHAGLQPYEDFNLKGAVMSLTHLIGFLRIPMYTLFATFVIFASVSPELAEAWDGKRKGFTLGFTAGRGISYVDSKGRNPSFTYGYDYRSRGITAIDWVIGYSTSDRLLLAFGATSQSNSIAALTFNGTYFLNPMARTWLVEGRVVIIGETPSSGTEGVYGASGGFGSEFTPHWMIVTDLLYLRASRSRSTFSYRQNAFTWKVGIRLLGY